MLVVAHARFVKNAGFDSIFFCTTCNITGKSYWPHNLEVISCVKEITVEITNEDYVTIIL
jgi:hypothetical protein